VVGQVASQTLENLTRIADASGLEILRPLVGMDKDEISLAAERLGTLTISNIPDQDCCTLFTPKHPATKASRHDIAAAEALLPIDEMVEATVARVSIEEFTFPMLKSEARPGTEEYT
jgi:thiamine biosynthesis protein ThiI